MHKPDAHEEMERALMRLMPVSLSEGAQSEIEAQFDELAGEAGVVGFDFSRTTKWLAGTGIAAAVAIGFAVFLIGQQKASPVAATPQGDQGLVFLTASDRVENVSDEGLFVDAGGSAIRKVRVRVVEESRIRDEETGIVVMLTEPREEMYSVPVSTF
jgi:hypothetical protein